MKFNVEFNSKINEPWRDYYMQYNQLNAQLKDPISTNALNLQSFQRRIEIELRKVYGFVQKHLDQLKNRINACGSTLKDYKSRIEVDEYAYDAVADKLAEILVDVDDIAKFHNLNLSAFDRIIKKYEKITGSNLMTHHFNKLLEAYPLDKQKFDDLIVQISEQHDVCRLHGNPRVAQAYDVGEEQTAFERATNKYWVHPDHINEVKAVILLHLPIYVFNQRKQYESKDAAVSSVYFDNENFDLYHERLERSKGAEAIRMRWYGQCDELNDDVYIERKTHHAPWLDERSIKDRFRLKEGQVNGFIKGVYSVNDYKKDLELKKKMNPLSIEENCFIAGGIQKSIKERQLQPVCRVFYNRTAFQFPGDQRLRISLDSNLIFIREDHFDGTRRRMDKTGKENWRRSDIDIEYPFRNVKEHDILRFPYAILETKIQSHLGQTIPAWLNQLLDSHLVHEVPHFSKYIHGASYLFNDRVPKMPYWLSELDYDIRKPVTPNAGLSRSKSFKPLFNGRHRHSITQEHITQQKELERPKRLDVPHLSLNFHDNPVPPVTNENTPNRDLLSKYFLNNKLTEEKNHDYKASPLAPSELLNSTPINKRKNLPMKKSDPKSFFANERTFISWLQFCALMLTVSLNLLNYGDRISRIVGACFIVISSAIAMYALARFQLRSYYMRTGRSASNMEDIYGPVLLCILLVGALCVNFYLRAPLIFSSLGPGSSSPAQPML
ncbi:VTC domain-containing protein [Choanephora cucurbitarum]|nr:VTC domain-containing protein [Choanephora cucurbitarum]